MSAQVAGRALIWLCLILAGLGLIFLWLPAQNGSGDWLDSDITHLMPAGHQDALVAEAMGRDRIGISGEWLLMLEGPEDPSRAALEAIQSRIAASAVASPLAVGDPETLLHVFKPYQFQLLRPATLDRLRANPASAYLTAVQSRLARPAPAVGLPFDQDPPGFLGEYLAAQPNPYPGFSRRQDAWLKSADAGSVWFLPLSLSGSAFQATVQSEQQALLSSLREAVATHCSDCRLSSTGPVHFAAEQRDLARGEVLLISSLSLSGILLLTLLAFGSLRPLLMGTLALGSGVLMAVALSLLLFDRLHVITLVAGSTLLGIAIDYVFKYLVHRADRHAPHRPGAGLVQYLQRPLLLGVLSSLLCLGVLAVSPFPVLRELAVFSAAGLAGAWLTVVLLFPFLDGGLSLRLRESVAVAGQWPLQRLAGRPWLRRGLPLLLLPMGLLAFWQMPGSDDLRSFQADLPQQMAVDQHIRQTTYTYFPAGFFLIEGADTQEVLSREQSLRRALDEHGIQHRSVALSRLIPPPEQQLESHALIGAALHDESLDQALAALGLAESDRAGLRRRWAESAGAVLRPEDLVEGPLARLSEQLWLQAEQRQASLMIPRGVSGELNRLALPEGVRLIDPMALMNRNLSEQRAAASRWILLAAALGIPALFCLLLGLRRGLPASLAPLSALALTLMFLWLSGIGLNTFVLMGVILGLGVGADYAAFLAAESRPSRAAMAGVGLAALTTLLAFGLLGLSQVPALGQFGVTVIAAILSAYVCAFVLAASSQREGEQPSS